MHKTGSGSTVGSPWNQNGLLLPSALAGQSDCLVVAAAIRSSIWLVALAAALFALVQHVEGE